MTHDHYSTEICKGVLAVAVNALALVTSSMQDIEYWLRVSSLGIGIVVGVLTGISIIKRQFK